MPLTGHGRRIGDGGGAGAGTSLDRLERWKRVKALFLEAVELPEVERAAFVAQNSDGDASLRSEVESLLASEDAAASFCERPAPELLGAELRFGPESAPLLANGARLGVYEITGFIAAGGMGSVYRARHTLIGRDIALKTVGQRCPDDTARRRLIREARHAATLTHPNICAVHDVGEADGIPFIVMEYIDGRPLNELLRAALPPLTTSLEYGIQITRALEHAHAHGIIHRDLKSSNVVVDDRDRAIVLDFGLARRLPDGAGLQSHEPTATSTDTLAGTLSHMAPELLRGQAADPRSDVWALGVLLYELVTGELPFTGRTPFETSSAILGASPRPMRRGVPLALRLVIERCLCKDPGGRYQQARGVGDALDAIRRRRAWPLVGRLLVSARRRTLYALTAAAVLLSALVMAGSPLSERFGDSGPRRISTLALLPLENATGDPGAEYFAQGLTDAFIAQLGAASDLRVLSRASTMRGVTRSMPPAEMGRRLGADVIVRGVLRRAGERIAVDVRLVAAADGRTLWSEGFERDAKDVLTLEADVVRALTGAIQLTMRPGMRERLSTVRAVSPDVYTEYLKGRYEWNKRTRSSLQLAIAHFTRAVELDPTYAPAHAALADCFNQLGTVMLGTGSPRDYRPRAAAAAISALQLDAYSAEAHAALGYVWHYDLRWTDAERELRRAIELNPSYSMARIWYANLLMSQLRMTEALEQVSAARGLDPFSLIVGTNVGWVLDRAGRYDEAIAQLTETLAIDSSYVQARVRLASSLTHAGRYAEALAQASRVVALTDSAPHALATLAIVQARAGQRDEARRVLAQLLARSRTEYVPPPSIALVLARLGEVDSAMVWIEKAFAERSNAIVYLAGDYEGTPLRSDPRFEALLVRAGLK